MIRAATTGKDGKPVVILGIDDESVRRLRAGEPIHVNLAELGAPETRLFIYYGADEAELVRSLAPLIGPDTKISDQRHLGDGHVGEEPATPCAG